MKILLCFDYIFYIGMHQKPSEITSIWVHASVKMELLASKLINSLICNKSYVYLVLQYSFGSFYRYKWTTYGEAAAARTAIGSGLVAHGIPKVIISSFKFHICLGY